MADAHDKLGSLSPEQRRALLKKLVAERDAAASAPGESAETTTITSAEGTQTPEISAPASMAQRRLWLLAQIEPDARAYNLLNAFRLRGAVDAEALERGLEHIVRRHEALRTVFRLRDGLPLQIVLPPESAWERVDLTAVPAGDQEAVAHQEAVRRASAPYDLEHGPLFRWALLKLSADHHVLLLMMHHIVADNWSFGVINDELARLYEALRRGAEEPLEPLPMQMGEYARWELAELQGAELERQMSYWVEALADVEISQIEPDRPRPPVQTYRGATRSFELPEALEGRLEAVRGRSRATRHMFYLAAFHLLLAKLTARSEVSCGSPIANRGRSEAEALVGFFVNTLVMRSRADSSLRWPEFLEEIRQVCLKAYAHPNVPFDALVEALHVERDLSRNPLYQITFQYGLLPPLRLAGLEVENVYLLDYGVVRSDLEMYLVAEEGRCRGVLVYNHDLYEEATAARLVELYRTLLEHIAAAPEARLEDLSPLTTAAREQLLLQAVAPPAPYSQDATVAEAFHRVAAAQPLAVALEFGDETVTYGELARRVGQLAAFLRTRGVAVETPVGVCLERSVGSIVGLLGVLQAGGFYVPLDPQHPPRRLRTILEEVGAPLCLVPEAEDEDGVALDFGPTVTTFTLDAAIGGEEEPSIAPGLGPQNLAYAIYTSGSTGRPKGVLVTHRSILALVLNARYAPLDATDRVLHASNVAFDAATWEIYGALLNGGTLVGVSKETALSVDHYVALLRERAITAAFLTTALFNRAVDADAAAFHPLRYLLFGGEAVDPQRVRQVLAAGPPERFLHVYGPTEATTYASYHPILEVAAQATTVPIGGPLARTSLHVATGVWELAPTRYAGELLIGGDGLARGYGADPRLTAQRFVPDPFGSEAGARLYRSGDLVRREGDGAVEFLGRVDQQVKLRGFRIELGEIEAALVAQDDVRQAVAAVREVRPGDRRLVAYVEPAPGRDPRLESLRDALRQRLPDYMVPTLFVVLDDFPMTPGGKIHRRALPPPAEATTLAGDAPIIPADGEVERRIEAVWREVLAVEHLGVEHNFFDLGGNSLLMVQVRQALQESLDREVSMIELFQYPSIRSLATYLEQGASVASVEQGTERGEQRKASAARGRSLRDRRRSARRRDGS